MKDLISAVTDAVRAANPGRRVEVSDCRTIPMAGRVVPRVTFGGPDDFAKEFEAAGVAEYGTPELVQVYIKRSGDKLVAEFAIPA